MTRTELPKWPLLLVKGKRITPEQADKVIIRTTNLYSLECNDHQWNKIVKDAFGYRLELEKMKRLHPQASRNLEHDAWEVVQERLGVLNLYYLANERISTFCVDGPYGWCNWNGVINTPGMVIGKWPSIEDITTDWQTIARAFPFLSLKAQLVTDEFAGDTGGVPFNPLVRWTVREGQVFLHEEPSERILERSEESIAMMNSYTERGVEEKRLRAAIKRCFHSKN